LVQRLRAWSNRRLRATGASASIRRPIWASRTTCASVSANMSSGLLPTGPRLSVARARIPDSYGDENTVVKMNSGNGEHEEMDRRAIACFDQALADVGLANNDALRQVLHDYFAWATTITMSRYHHSADDVPNGLSIPRWSWNGLQV
jgi:hypothetical protein